MKTADVLPRMYEDLANYFARQGDTQRRDQCLVLAADAALRNGQPEEAERLRKRLLLTNPEHLLRPFYVDGRGDAGERRSRLRRRSAQAVAG